LDCFRASHPFDEAYVLGTFAGVELQSLGQDSSLDTLDLWRQEFNYERPHEALGMRCPAEIYQNSNRKYGGSPQFARSSLQLPNAKLKSATLAALSDFPN
jgi:hypothetical protein